MGKTTFEGLRVFEGSSQIRKASGCKPRSHQKDLQKRSMAENDKISTEEENLNSNSRIIKKSEGKTH